MSEEKKVDHRQLGVELFNYVWELLDKPNRTREEIDTMIHAAHASRFHWEKVGTAINLARGEWQISRTYAVVGRSEPARYHAQRCLDITLENSIGDFDLAFAYEALARASAIAGDSDAVRNYIKKAKQAGEDIQEQENKDYFFSELKSIPGYP